MNIYRLVIMNDKGVIKVVERFLEPHHYKRLEIMKGIKDHRGYTLIKINKL